MNRIIYKKDKAGNDTVSIMLHSGKRIDLDFNDYTDLSSLLSDDLMKNMLLAYIKKYKIKIKKNNNLDYASSVLSTLALFRTPKKFFEKALEIANAKEDVKIAG